ncbi:MAG: hypothetical protein OEV47_18255, partial [Gammaproteobacteria bacterium]|nr:hypothetical protein [Gammaproteobacteria bacterium]
MLRTNLYWRVDSMVSPSNLLSLALLYICILFAVAWYADRYSGRAGQHGDDSGRILGLPAPKVRGSIY